MSQISEIDSYKKIQRLPDDELEQLWDIYLKDKSLKEVRDKLILQYVYLAKYVVGRVKVNLPPSFSFDDVVSFGIEGLIDAIENVNKLARKLKIYNYCRVEEYICD